MSICFTPKRNPLEDNVFLDLGVYLEVGSKKMSLSTTEEESMEIRLPADVDWDMLDKSRFFFLGAALFSGVSTALYPAVVLKTRQQVQPALVPCYIMAFMMFRHEGTRAFYKGFGTSLMGTIPASALYMTALEMTKSNVGSASIRVGLSGACAATIAQCCYWVECSHGITACLDPS